MTDLRQAITDTAQSIAAATCCPNCGSVYQPYATSGPARQRRDTLTFIRDYIEANGCSPSFDEIAAAIGLRAKSGVHRIVHDLIDRGLLEYTPDKKRTLRFPAREGI